MTLQRLWKWLLNTLEKNNPSDRFNEGSMFDKVIEADSPKISDYHKVSIKELPGNWNILIRKKP